MLKLVQFNVQGFAKCMKGVQLLKDIFILKNVATFVLLLLYSPLEKEFFCLQFLNHIPYWHIVIFKYQGLFPFGILYFAREILHIVSQLRLLSILFGSKLCTESLRFIHVYIHFLLINSIKYIISKLYIRLINNNKSTYADYCLNSDLNNKGERISCKQICLNVKVCQIIGKQQQQSAKMRGQKKESTKGYDHPSHLNLDYISPWHIRGEDNQQSQSLIPSYRKQLFNSFMLSIRKKQRPISKATSNANISKSRTQNITSNSFQSQSPNQSHSEQIQSSFDTQKRAATAQRTTKRRQMMSHGSGRLRKLQQTIGSEIVFVKRLKQARQGQMNRQSMILNMNTIPSPGKTFITHSTENSPALKTYKQSTSFVDFIAKQKSSKKVSVYETAFAKKKRDQQLIKNLKRRFGSKSIKNQCSLPFDGVTLLDRPQSHGSIYKNKRRTHYKTEPTSVFL